MIVISLRFPSGRLHATPWSRHVNEGQPEWPPSPWRLLRSLVATWKLKFEEIPQEQVREILAALAKPPQFSLPAATLGHTRHYMRWYKKGPEDQALVLDAFICLRRRSEVVVAWPQADLDSRQRVTLKRLLDGLSYLGRAESWCEARLLDSQAASGIEANCLPLDGEETRIGSEPVRVLCADPETAFADEHVKANGKRPVYDPEWHLCIDTAQLHSEKWSDPPGARWVTYLRPTDCFEAPALKAPRRRSSRPRMQVARFVLDSSVLPLAQECLPLAEQVRIGLMGLYGRLNPGPGGARGRSALLSGKDSAGDPLLGHGHAYYLPTDEDGDGRLDHLTIMAEDGFGKGELKALDRLRILKRGEDASPIQLLLTGLGLLEEFQPGPLAPSRRWVSATPFLVTRFPKKSGRKRDPRRLLTDPRAFISQVLWEELQRLFERRRLNWRQSDVRIEPIDHPQGVYRIQPDLWAEGAAGPTLRPLQFKRFRSRKRGDDGGRRWSGSFLLSLPEPIRGPVCLGHSSHFGLGLFLPAAAMSRS